MNLLLDIPPEILFLLVQCLDVVDVMRLSRISKFMQEEVSACIREIYFPSKNMWKLVKEKGRSDFQTQQLKALRYIYPEPSRYSLVLPPIRLLSQYPLLSKSNVPFIGSIPELLAIDPSSLIFNQKVSLVCTSPEKTAFTDRYPHIECWTPLPAGSDQSLYQRMKEWLVAFILNHPDVTLSLIIIPEKNLIQTEDSFRLYYNAFSYFDHQVETTLPYILKTPEITLDDIDSDFVFPPKIPLYTSSAISVNQWLNTIDQIPTDDVEILISTYSPYSYETKQNEICAVLEKSFPSAFRRKRMQWISSGYGYASRSTYDDIIFSRVGRSDIYDMPETWHYDTSAGQAVGRILRTTGKTVTYGDTDNIEIPADLGLLSPLGNMDAFRRLVKRYVRKHERKTRRASNTHEKRITLVPKKNL